MTYKIPDLTGSNPDYAITGDVTMFVTTNTSLKFPDSIYATSLTIYPFGETTPLVEGTDYVFNPSDYDYTTMAATMASVAGWDKSLLHSFTIIRPEAQLPLKVSMSYQTFYLRTPTVPVTNAAGSINFTPDLAAEMYNDLVTIKQTLFSSVATAATTTEHPVLLEEDINETNSANVVTNEQWTVDTYSNNSVIFPVQGAFFADSVTVEIPASSGGSAQTLVVNQDYMFQGLLPVMTSLSTNNSGIYALIKILKPFSGQVNITYHALGGMVTTKIFGWAVQELSQIKQLLGTSNYLTASSLSSTPLIQTMQQQIEGIQSQMRAQVLNPTYGDSTNGTTVVKQIRSTDTAEHWFTVASLYQVATSNPQQPVLTDHDGMNLHVQMTKAAYIADVNIAFNLNNSNYPFSVNVTNMIGKPGFTLWGTVDTTATIYPKWRVVYNQDPNAFTGAYLQIGMSLPSLTETLTIEDVSGVESTWILNTETGTSSSPLTYEDDGFTLPDGKSVWSASGGVSVQHAQTAQNTTGYMVLAGAYNLGTFDSTQSSPFSQNTLLPTSFLLKDIKRVDLWFSDNSNPSTERWVVSVPMCSTPTLSTGGALIPLTIQSAGVVGWFTLSLSQTASNTVATLSIVGTASTTDIIALRYVIAHV
ncbi:MAG: hypothetical protein J6S85_23815 [Methanobrevibacter sp.]|nr:hypothetical protein [Methanobrevibacter sp.]